MHTHSVDPWRQSHEFLGARHAANERRTWFVVALTAVMMVVEIVAGLAFGSMALLADGWHMGTHAGALGISAAAYWLARRHHRDERFSFGVGKFGDLAGYTSGVSLLLISGLIAYESATRLLDPVPIAFDQAILVAAIGLGVNIASAWVLGGGHDHADHHDHDHDHDHDHADDHGAGGQAAEGAGPHRHDHALKRDYSLRAAYIHVLADALTSVLAIAALILGRFQGWVWLDPAIGVLGALVIARWSWSLMADTAWVLLDARADTALQEQVRQVVEAANGGTDRVSDLHVWRVGPGHQAAIVAIVTNHPRPPSVYKEALKTRFGFSHVTVEVEPCPGEGGGKG